MIKRVVRYLRQHHLALLALFIVLGGGSAYAAATLVPRNSVGSAQVINGSLQTLDLSKKARKALKGNRGLRGPAGAQGAKGTTGAQGIQGIQGARGPTGPAGLAATSLFAAVSADCASLDRGSGALTASLGAGARCDVQFNQSVKNCVPVASLRRDVGGGNYNTEIALATNSAGVYSGLTDDEIGVVYFDNAGNLITSGRPPFDLAVFC